MMNRFTYIDIIQDIIKGAKHWRIWSVLAWNMLKMEYRRTIIGPFWIVLQQSILIVALGYIFASIQKAEYVSFYVYFATGYTFWVLIYSFVTYAGNTFMGINGLPHMTREAFSNHIYLHITCQMLRFIHLIIPLIVILIIYHKVNVINIPLLICGIVMLMVFGFWVTVVLGCLSLRFQDLGLAVASIMQIMFFVTPVMFQASRVPGGDSLSMFNPFYHLLIVVRGNIINENVTLINWVAVLIINIIGICLALVVFRWARPKLAYWA